MNRLRRVSGLLLTTLSVFFASVFFLGSAVSAQSLVEVRPLSHNETIILQQSQAVEEKSTTLQSTIDELQILEEKKEALAKQLEAEKQKIEELKAKIAEKRRIEAIQAEERARLAAYVEPEVTRAPYYTPPTKRYAGNSAGNSYTAGQCTWHVKNMKPELPNFLGNADTWFSNARAQGWPTGYEARAGAAAQTKVGMHVVYVLEVYGNGTMLISEMNFAGPYSQRNAVVNQSDYLYIY